MAELNAFFLVGPTAIGKTAVCQLIAEKQRFDILSADSMMVYRGMNIGTAKPDRAFRSKINYGGLDLVEAHEHFSAGMFRGYAVCILRQAAAAGRQMIVTGGTGLYIKSLTHGLVKQTTVDVKIREKADEIMRQGGINDLQKWAENQAPGLYEAIIDKKNPRRLVRAVEMAHGSATMPRQRWRELGKGPRILGLSMPMNQLYERIKLRVDEMYARGLLKEVEKLMKTGLESAPTAAKAIGYAEAIGVLHGTMSLDEAIEKTAKRTRQLAKRQMTWFRNQANVEWLALDPGLPVEQIAQMVLECWEKSGPTPIIE